MGRKLSKQDCTEAIWGPHTPPVWRPCTSPKGKVPTVLITGLLTARSDAGNWLTRWHDTTLIAPPRMLRICANKRSCKVSQIYYFIWYSQHLTEMAGPTLAPQETVRKFKYQPKIRQQFSSPDLSKSGLVGLIFNRTPQSLNTTQTGKWRNGVICLRSHTHAKHYRIITCSCKMIPINYKVASQRKEQPGMGDLTHHQCRTCH